MARDATLIPSFTRDTVGFNYPSQLAQVFLDYGQVSVHLKLPIAFGTADAAVLCTVPTGYKLKIGAIFWEITTSFTGGSSSAIGISSNDTGYNTKGDVLGGATGDVAGVLLSTGAVYRTGTAGAKFAASSAAGIVVIGSGKTIRYDQITSTFTAGAGFVHIDGQLID